MAAKETVVGEVVENASSEKKQGRLTRFRTNHPRAARALAVTGLLVLVGGGAYGLGKKQSALSEDDSTLDNSSDLPTDFTSES